MTVRPAPDSLQSGLALGSGFIARTRETRMKRIHAAAVATAVLTIGLSGCATQPDVSAAEPVIVKTPDAEQQLASNSWRATHFKIGSRWFPRCQTFNTLGTRVDGDVACLTEEQMQEVVLRGQFLQDDLSSRGAIQIGPQGY